jgi:L-cysteine:1D-myo-inositol 2-amino-2-deoxy-alpha-D-glucopyranoside ligase
MRSWPASPLRRLPGRGLPVRLHDTATRQLRPLSPGPLTRLYVCGITPYDATHIGHAATYLAYDVLIRQLFDAGHEVDYVQNVTDVDDPLLERAQADGIDWRDLADRETQRFRDDMAALNVLPPRHFIGAVEAIPDIAALVETLDAKGAAYRLDSDVYFPVSKAPRFGQIGHLGYDQMLALAAERGGDPNRPGKHDPLDPLLWRAERPGEPAWDSPLGRGRPGWHVECAAIALRYLGTPIDVQGGGMDLVFPHHECSAAHAEVATGQRPFARAYVHAAMVRYEGHKMSKSLGNLVFVSRLRADGVEPAAIRLAVLGRHYRRPWEWTADGLEAGRGRLRRWREAVGGPAAPPAHHLLDDVRRHIADDLDAPAALRAVDRWAEQARTSGGRDRHAPGLVRDLVWTLLGVTL